MKEAIAEAKTIDGVVVPRFAEVGKVETTSVRRVASAVKLRRRTDYQGAGAGTSAVFWCGSCGLRGHRGGESDCPAWGKECLKCRKKNHYARCCRSKSDIPPRQKQVIAIEDISVLQVIGTTSNMDYKTCECEIVKAKINLVIDLGAKVSVLNNKTLAKAEIRLVSFDGSGIELLEKLLVPVKFRNGCLEAFPFYITASGVNIMGIDLFDALEFQVVTEKDSQIQQVLQKWSKLQTVFTGLGKVRGYALRPLVLAEIKPVAQHLHRIPSSLRDEVKTEIKRLQKEGVIKKTKASECVSNVVPITKKAELLCLCIDLRHLNNAIVPGKYPLPTVEELAAEFHGSTIFSKLDLRQGYLQVHLTEDSWHLTNFVTHEEMYRFCRMAFGLSSAPRAFQQMMKSTLSGLNGVAVFMDDILVHGCTIEAHDCYLDKVLQRLSERTLTLNKEKCVIAAREVEFLGYSVSAQGITPLESNV